MAQARPGDRVGVRPLYHCEHAGRISFASEAKALFAADPTLPRAFDPIGLDQTFTFWSVVAPRTIFAGISELGLPGTDDISPGHDVVMPAFTPQPFQRGTHPFSCTQENCGGDPEQHRGMAGAIIIQ